MKIGYAEVVENQRLYAATYITWFRAPDLARSACPGQFLMLRCDDESSYELPNGQRPTTNDHNPTSNIQHPTSATDFDPLLPRPMSYHRLREGPHGPEWSILYDVVGRGTAWLSRRKPGDRVYAWGPLGNGYKVGRTSRNLLLVAGGIGVAPLVWLADHAVARGLNVTMVLGAREAAHLYPAHLLHPEVEVVVTTDDGSAGRKGFVTEPFAELLEWCDQAFACGPTPMFRALAEAARRSKSRRSVQALLEERMACGTGICYGCAVEVRVRGGGRRRGSPQATAMKLICKDGPRFDLRDVY